LDGIVFALLGMAALIHPEMGMPANREEIQIRPEKVQLDSRRIIDMSRILSGKIVLASDGLALLGTKSH